MVRLAILSVLLLSGCATCHRHARRCEIAATVIAGAAVLALGARDWNRTTVRGPYTRAP